MKIVKVIIAMGVILGLMAGAAYTFWLKPQLEFANVATAFAAKKVCSCLHVAEMSLEQCRADFTDDVSMATIIAEGQTVTVEVLGGRVSSRAVHTPDLGCTLLPAEQRSL
ncbi:MAG: hypothetical protein AAFP97_01065 [Pseudomonadota bacterium]